MHEPTISEREVAFHEAGHYVAAYLLQSWAIRDSISIKPTEGSLGRVHSEDALLDYFDDGTGAYNPARCAEAIIVLLAGLEAQCRLEGVERAQALETAGSDLEKVAELLTECPELDRAVLDAQCAELVTREWARIGLLAAAVLEHKQLGGEAADVVCDLFEAGSSLQWALGMFVRVGVLSGKPTEDGQLSVEIPAWLSVHFERASSLPEATP